jgi:hypothetical protein
VCSGCSGDYAGEFDDSGESSSDRGGDNRPAWNCGEPQEPGNRRNSRKARDFEGRSNSKRDSQSAIVSGLGEEGAADVWEILVSGARITEIRVIAADGGRISELAQTGIAKTPLAAKHSAPSSAKYYQTRRTGWQSSTNHVQMSFLPGIMGFVTREFGRWVQWARKAFGESRAEISE